MYLQSNQLKNNKRLFVLGFLILTSVFIIVTVIALIQRIDDRLYGSGSIPEIALSGVNRQTARMVETFRLSSVIEAGIPKSSTVKIFRAQNSNGKWEMRVFINFGSYTGLHKAVYLGNLTYQLPVTPIQTIMFETGGTLFMAGCVDENVEGDLEYINFSNFDPNPLQIDSVATTISPQRCFINFYIPGKTDWWKSIGRVQIMSKESLEKSVNQHIGNGNKWEKIYNPPIEIAPLVIHIPIPTEFSTQSK